MFTLGMILLNFYLQNTFDINQLFDYLTLKINEQKLKEILKSTLEIKKSENDEPGI